ncbi:UDP-glycosyltransferase 88B1-like [Typha angustifolia]|uniref:UDP-glycosyltransferase 88B1-like n=1 Tax=Typha angustifolia TaxID=59011 RepID=UPI003C2DC396
MANTNSTVVLFPSPGMGHLVSMVELGNLLTHRHGLSVVVLVLEPPFHTGAATAGFIPKAISSNPSISFVRLPSITKLPPNNSPNHEALAFDLLRLSNPNLLSTLKNLSASSSSPIRALILDFFCTDALDVAEQLSIPAYFFYTSNASALASFLHFPILHARISSSFKDMDKTPIIFPGLPPIPASDMLLPLLDREDSAYKGFIRHFSRLPLADGILVNSFESLEPRALEAIRTGSCLPDRTIPPVYCVGPVIRDGKRETRHESAQWLDAQPCGSVVFLCFGSLGVFTEEQIREIARGLENSGHRFLWVVRVAADTTRLYDRPAEPDLDRVLPEGFVERTKGRGLVLKTWAPQVEVLGHVAVGGFVTHAGWNSVLEGIWAGVPMVAWPLYAEQRMNKVVMEEELGIGVGIEGYERAVVGAEEVERKIRWLMESEEGRRLRDRTARMKSAARAAMEEGGSSYRALKEVADKWKGLVG